MPWRDLKVAKDCNRCRRTLSAGAHVYQGEITGATWCADCAGELGLDREVTLPVAVLRSSGMTGFQELLAAFKAKHTRRDLSARILGEGEE